MELSIAIRIMVIVGLLAFYSGFVIRLLRNGRRKVLISALLFSVQMLLGPFFFPYYLYHLRKSKTLEQIVQTALDETVRNQNISKEVYDFAYKQVLQKLSSPSFFLRLSGNLIVDFFRNWDNYIDILVSATPQKDNIKISFAETLIYHLLRVINRNKIYHLGAV